MSIAKPIMGVFLISALGVGGFFGYKAVTTAKNKVEDSDVVAAQDMLSGKKTVVPVETRKEEKSNEVKLNWIAELVGNSQDAGVKTTWVCLGADKHVQVETAKSPFSKEGSSLKSNYASVVIKSDGTAVSTRLLEAPLPTDVKALFDIPAPSLNCNAATSQWSGALQGLLFSLNKPFKASGYKANLGGLTLNFSAIKSKDLVTSWAFKMQGSKDQVQTSFGQILNALSKEGLVQPQVHVQFKSSPLASKVQEYHKVAYMQRAANVDVITTINDANDSNKNTVELIISSRAKPSQSSLKQSLSKPQ